MLRLVQIDIGSEQVEVDREALAVQTVGDAFAARCVELRLLRRAIRLGESQLIAARVGVRDELTDKTRE